MDWEGESGPIRRQQRLVAIQTTAAAVAYSVEPQLMHSEAVGNASRWLTIRGEDF